MPYILAIDQGTTKTECLLINEKGRKVASEKYNFPQHFPQPGWVEHLGAEVKESVKKTIQACIKKAKISPTEIDCIGITNQRETTCLFDEQGIAPLPFIVWQCRRSEKQSEKLIKHKNLISQITGLRPDPYFSGTKLMWIFENYPQFLHRAERAEILFGTIDSFLAYWFSGYKLHVTDVSNASRTMLMNIESLAYSDEMISLLNVPKAFLPAIVKNIGPYGHTKGLGFLPDGIPIAALIGDQQSALFAQRCFNPGQTKLTLGTGAFILQNIGDDPLISKAGLLTSIAYWIDEKPKYCLEGSALAAGAAIQFLIDNLKFGESFSEIENLLKDIRDSGEILFIPAICGLGATYWQPNVRGAFLGLSRASTKAQIAYSVFEGVALQNADIFLNMENTEERLLIDGGLAKSHIIMQMHADLLGIPCIRDDEEEKTSLGAAYLAGLSAGIISSVKNLPEVKPKREVFYPRMDKFERSKKIAKYRKGVQTLIVDASTN